MNKTQNAVTSYCMILIEQCNNVFCVFLFLIVFLVFTITEPYVKLVNLRKVFSNVP